MQLPAAEEEEGDASLVREEEVLREKDAHVVQDVALQEEVVQDEEVVQEGYVTAEEEEEGGKVVEEEGPVPSTLVVEEEKEHSRFAKSFAAPRGASAGGVAREKSVESEKSWERLSQLKEPKKSGGDQAAKLAAFAAKKAAAAPKVRRTALHSTNLD